MKSRRGTLLAWLLVSDLGRNPLRAGSSVIMEREWPGAAGGGGRPGAGVLVMAVWLVT